MSCSQLELVKKEPTKQILKPIIEVVHNWTDLANDNPQGEPFHELDSIVAVGSLVDTGMEWVLSITSATNSRV